MSIYDSNTSNRPRVHVYRRIGTSIRVSKIHKLHSVKLGRPVGSTLVGHQVHPLPTVKLGRLVGSTQFEKVETSDIHHCKCFVIDEDIEVFRIKLENIGGTDQIQEPHGQVFGRAIRVADDLQIHIKPMPNREIEAEMEPPPDLPGAHLNPEHSYPAHKELLEILYRIETPYHLKGRTPLTCLQPVIIKPVKPMHIVTMAIVGIVVVALVAIGYSLAKGGRV